MRQGIVRLDSDQFNAHINMRAWRDIVARSVLGLDFQPTGSGRFHAQVSALAAGSVTMTSMRISPGSTVRDRELAETNADTYTFAWANSQQVVAAQRGSAAELGVGQAVLLTSGEVGSIACPRGGRFAAALVPRALLTRGDADIEDQIMRPFARQDDRLRLIRSYTGLIEKYADTAGPEVLSAMGSHLIELIRLLLDRRISAPDYAASDSVETSRYQLLTSRLAEQFDNPALDLGTLAQSCGLSQRYVQLLFERAGTSYSSHLLNLRLDHARKLLEDGSMPQAKIIDIAFAAGFSDVSYFNRRFRAKFGDTPTAYRAGKQR